MMMEINTGGDVLSAVYAVIKRTGDHLRHDWPQEPVPLMATANDVAMALAAAESPCTEAKATAMATEATVLRAPCTSPELIWLTVAVANAWAAACVLPVDAARANAAALAATLPFELCECT